MDLSWMNGGGEQHAHLCAIHQHFQGDCMKAFNATVCHAIFTFCFVRAKSYMTGYTHLNLLAKDCQRYNIQYNSK